MGNYSVILGVWKTIKNGLIVLAPSIIAFIAELPPEISAQYTIPLGFVLYFLKNLIQVKRE